MKSLLFLIALLCIASVVESHVDTFRGGRGKDAWKQRTIYQVLTDRYAKGDGSKGSCKDLSKYCGGTYKGLIKELDYIQGMGFDAIWVSPILKNLDGGYHGYWATDLYSLNENFGTEQDFKDLIEELHKRDMWIMVDVVANHVGPVGMDFSGINPFNQPEHYHERCIISDSDFANNQERVENCRLADLPDLAQENDFVRTTLLSWIKDLVQKYNIDGLRIDTIPEVPKWFWTQFQEAAGVYAVGEVFDMRLGYVADYQNYVDAVLNYPLRNAINDVWRYNSKNFRDLASSMNENRNAFKDVDALGVFVDNHDNERFLHGNSNHAGLEAATIFGIFAEGIPMVYYGTEQYYGGGADPANREQLWTNFDTSSNLYQMLKAAIQTRKDHKTWDQKYVERYVDDHFLAFSRGDVLIAVTNQGGSVGNYVTYLPFSKGDTICNIFNSSDCLTVGDGVQITLDNYQTKVYVKSSNNAQESIKE